MESIIMIITRRNVFHYLKSSLPHNFKTTWNITEIKFGYQLIHGTREVIWGIILKYFKYEHDPYLQCEKYAEYIAINKYYA